MLAPITRELGAFVAGLDAAAVPEEALRTAGMGVIDCVGVMIAGCTQDAPRLLAQTLDPAPGKAALCGSERSATAPEAAWINAVAAHALDYDDVAIGGHPSTVLVPAILAEAQELDRSGRDLLAAYIAGYEVWAELWRREPDSLHSKGWHPTGIWGAVAAAAACASLRRLDAGKAANAIALGASQSAGVMANFGTMTKPFHAGRAAHAGILAARLAEAGFTASLDAIEHPQGLLSAVSPGGRVDRERAVAAGRDWQILERGLNIKKFPACYCVHRAVDGMLALRETSGLRPESVASVRVRISDKFATILRNHRPTTGLEAKFSMEFAMASALVAGRVGLSELTNAFVQRADVQALIERVEMDLTQDYDPSHPNAAVYDQVCIVGTAGERLDGEQVRYARGHAARPLSEQELYGKFEDCLEYAGTKERAPEIFDRLRRIDRLNAREIAIH